MKILHIQAQLPAKTGSGVYFSNVIKGLQKKYDQACIYGCYPDFKYNLISEDKQFSVTFPNATCDFPLPGMSDVMPYQSTVYGEMTPEMIHNWQEVFKQALHQAIAEFQPDIIFCHHLWFLTSLVCQETDGIPIYAFCHGTDIRQANQHPDLFKKYVVGLNKLTHVFALSHPQVSQLYTLYGFSEKKITVIGGGFDPEIFYPGKKPNKDGIDLVYAGKISSAKGVFSLAKVFDQISSQFPNATLHLIGNASAEADKILEPFLQNPQIKLYNVPNQKALADLYRKCDIFILPSYYEGLGLVAIEALACDLRVVVTTIPTLQEQLGQTVNDSNVITYVDLPRLRNQDEPINSDLPAFYQRLGNALEYQIKNVEQKISFPEEVKKSVLTNSWPQLIDHIEDVIKQ